MRFQFRCDADAETGLGHLSRSKVLAEAIHELWPQAEVGWSGHWSEAVQGTFARDLRLDTPLPASAPVVAGLADLGPSDVAILDSYRTTAEDILHLASRGVRVGLFEDEGQLRGTGATVLWNARVRAPALRYSAQFVVAGPEYFPASGELREVRRTRIGRKISSEVKQVVVCLGGGAPRELGIELGLAARRVFSRATVRLFSAQAHSPRILSPGCMEHPLIASLGPVLANADLILAGGGRLKYEAAYCLVPCGSLALTALQAEDNGDLEQAGICADLGAARGSAALEESLKPLVSSQVRQTQVERQAALFPEDAPERWLTQLRAALGSSSHDSR